MLKRKLALREATSRISFHVEPRTSATIFATIPINAGEECFLPPMWKYGESVSTNSLSSGMALRAYFLASLKCWTRPVNPK